MLKRPIEGTTGPAQTAMLMFTQQQMENISQLVRSWTDYRLRGSNGWTGELCCPCWRVGGPRRGGRLAVRLFQKLCRVSSKRSGSSCRRAWFVQNLSEDGQKASRCVPPLFAMQRLDSGCRRQKRWERIRKDISNSRVVAQFGVPSPFAPESPGTGRLWRAVVIAACS